MRTDYKSLLWAAQGFCDFSLLELILSNTTKDWMDLFKLEAFVSIHMMEKYDAYVS